VGETTLLAFLKTGRGGGHRGTICYVMLYSTELRLYTSKRISFPLYFPLFSLDLTGLSSGHFALTDPLGVIPLPQLVLFGQRIHFRSLLCLIANCPPRSSLSQGHVASPSAPPRAFKHSTADSMKALAHEIWRRYLTSCCMPSPNVSPPCSSGAVCSGWAVPKVYIYTEQPHYPHTGTN
jgi:hypothetical protein